MRIGKSHKVKHPNIGVCVAHGVASRGIALNDYMYKNKYITKPCVVCVRVWVG